MSILYEDFVFLFTQKLQNIMSANSYNIVLVWYEMQHEKANHYWKTNRENMTVFDNEKCFAFFLLLFFRPLTSSPAIKLVMSVQKHIFQFHCLCGVALFCLLHFPSDFFHVIKHYVPCYTNDSHLKWPVYILSSMLLLYW